MKEFSKKHKDFEKTEHCSETFAIMRKSLISKTFSKIAKKKKKFEFLEKILIQESFEFEVQRTFLLRIS